MGNYCANTNIWIDMMRSIDKNMKTVIGNHKIDFLYFWHVLYYVGSVRMKIA